MTTNYEFENQYGENYLKSKEILYNKLDKIQEENNHLFIGTKLDSLIKHFTIKNIDNSVTIERHKDSELPVNVKEQINVVFEEFLLSLK
jgi:hypothetical protein